MHNDVLRQYWHPVAKAVDLVEKPVAARLLDERIVLYRAGSDVVAMQDLCVHRGTPLSLGWIDGETIVCAYHGWRYARDGGCVAIPSLPESRGIPRKARVPTYRAQERYGLIWVALEEPRSPIPEFPVFDDSRYRVITAEFRWHASAARGIENVLDYAHFPWVHEGLLGDRSQAIYPEVVPVASDSAISFAFPDDHNGTTRSYELSIPFTLRVVMTPLPDGRKAAGPSASGHSHGESGHSHGENEGYSVLFTFCPVSAKETIQWFLSARTDQREANSELDTIIVDQDQIIVENQRPEDLPLDLTAELHLRGIDAAALEYRRVLKRLGVAWT